MSRWGVRFPEAATILVFEVVGLLTGFEVVGVGGVEVSGESLRSLLGREGSFDAGDGV